MHNDFCFENNVVTKYICCDSYAVKVYVLGNLIFDAVMVSNVRIACLACSSVNCTDWQDWFFSEQTLAAYHCSAGNARG